jgi:hypothetical protein
MRSTQEGTIPLCTERKACILDDDNNDTDSISSTETNNIIDAQDDMRAVCPIEDCMRRDCAQCIATISEDEQAHSCSNSSLANPRDDSELYIGRLRRFRAIAHAVAVGIHNQTDASEGAHICNEDAFGSNGIPAEVMSNPECKRDV